MARMVFLASIIASGCGSRESSEPTWATSDTPRSGTSDSSPPPLVGGVPVTVEAYVGDSPVTELSVMVSDGDGSFVETHVIPNDGVSVELVVPAGGWVTVSHANPIAQLWMESIADVQSGDRLQYFWSRYATWHRPGEPFLEVQYEITDSGVGFVSYGSSCGSDWGRTPKPPPVAFSSREKGLSRCQDPDGNVHAWALAEDFAGTEAVAVASSVEVNGAVASATLDSWNLNPGRVAATYTHSGTDSVPILTVKVSRAGQHWHTSGYRRPDAVSGVAMAHASVDATYHDRAVVGLHRWDWKKGHTSEVFRIVGEIPADGLSTVVEMQQADLPPRFSMVQFDPLGAWVELGLWDGQCRGEAFDALRWDVSVEPNLGGDVLWMAIAPFTDRLELPTVDPDVFVLSEPKPYTTTTVKLTALALQGAGYSDIRASDQWGEELEHDPTWLLAADPAVVEWACAVSYRTQL